MDITQIKSLLNATTCAALQKVLNQQIDKQEAAKTQLLALEGKSCLIYLLQLDLAISIHVSGGRFIFGMVDKKQMEEEYYTAELYMQPMGLLRVLLAEDARSALAEEDVGLKGQVYLFIALQTIAKQLGISWKGEIEKLIGSLFAGGLFAYCDKIAEEIKNCNKSKLSEFLDDFIPADSDGQTQTVINNLGLRIKKLIARVTIAERSAGC